MEFWQVTSNCKLPKGYYLHEDTTGLYLYTYNELVAIFTRCTSTQLIEAVAYNHQDGLIAV